MLKISKLKKKTIKFTEKFTIKTYNVEKQLHKKDKMVKKGLQNANNMIKYSRCKLNGFGFASYLAPGT